MATNDRNELTGHFALVYPSKYIKAADLGGQDVTVTILRARLEAVEMEGGKKDQKAVFYLADHNGRPLQKTWVAGKTVLKQIGAALGTPSMGEWKGQRVTMYPTTCKGKGGETLECIRVRARIGRGTDIPQGMTEPNGEQQQQPNDRPSEPAGPSAEDITAIENLRERFRAAETSEEVQTIARDLAKLPKGHPIRVGANAAYKAADARCKGELPPGAEPPAVQS